MENKAIFLDIDGTLCDKSGVIPESAKKAIKVAKQKGHQFFLCTGRTKGEITQEILDLNVRGIIWAGGGYCEVERQVILHETLPEKELREMLNYFNGNNIAYYLQTSESLIATPNLKTEMKDLLLKYSKGDKNILKSVQWFFDLFIEETKIDYSQISKVCFINQTIDYKNIYHKFHSHFEIIPSTVPFWGEHSGEISVKGLSKKRPLILF